MRSLIIWFRAWFCKHEWEHINDSKVYACDHTNTSKDLPIRVMRTYRCKKCGYVQKIDLIGR